MNQRSSLFRLACTLVLPLVAAVACSSSSSDSNEDVSADQAATNAANAICDALQKCSPLLVQISYGDVATCKTRSKLGLQPALTANGTSLTASSLASCAQDLANATCDQLTTRDLPESCRTKPGTLQDGAACGADQQCQNRLCRKQAGTACGACSKLGASGTDCKINEECEFGLGCAGGKCAPFKGAGEKCDATNRCKPTLTCQSGTCGTPAGVDATCSSPGLESECDLAKGVACGVDKKCTQIQFVGPGQPCGLVEGKFVSCGGAGRCTALTGGGTCQAPAADGSACDDANGPLCVAPARCIGKVCKLDDPSTCK